jgi:hypothetical protein
MELVLNYTGRQQQFETDNALLRLEDFDPRISDVGPDMKRLGLFEIDVTVAHSVLKVAFAYNQRMHHQGRIENWIAQTKTTLEVLLGMLRCKGTVYTLSDFPLLPLTYDNLTALQTDCLASISLSSLEEVDDIYPCSPMQQGIILSQIKLRGSYEVQQVSQVLTKAGRKFDLDRFKEAWQQVVKRHPVLRTVFIKGLTSESAFDQLVLKNHDAEISYIKARDASEAVDALKKQISINVKATRPHHRLTICEVPTTGDVYYKVEISHALIDGMSIPILMRNLIQAYEGQLPLDNCALFSNFISYLQRQSIDSAVEYWTSYLENIQPSFIPTLPATNDQGVDYQVVHISMYATGLYDFCEQKGITPASLFKTAWALVLRCYTNSESVCFGYLASGRDIPLDGVSETVGVFITMLICRLNITPTASIEELLTEVQDDFVKSLPYQNCPLAEIQHRLGLSGESLFNTAISLQRSSPEIEVSSDLMFKKLYDKDPTEVGHQIPSFISMYTNSY